ncbi:molybdopterin molybdotransferase [Bradyrhizobium sp. i1.8.4]|uniref:molybdopterin-binding protein n=1 Tax=unclassified Bradyrhizobium TaxID=2631580 RepID=UPI003D1D0AC9
MTNAQRLPGSLTPLDVALHAVLGTLAPVAPIELPLADALRSVAAEMPPLGAQPPRDAAAADGWAMRANDLVGASSYAPLPLIAPPVWVEAGDVMPDGTDCVVDADVVDTSGPVAQVLGEAVPGQGVRRGGRDIGEGRAMTEPGRRVLPRDLLLARTAGLQKLGVRRPRLRLVNIPGGQTPGGRATVQFVAEAARAAGADVISVEATGRDAAAIASALDTGNCDLLITVGGTGVGRTDATVTALASRGEVLVHGIALQPGRTAAVARIGVTPVVALPGGPDQAFGAWCAIALPVLDRLAGHRARKTLGLPLARKIASSVGLAEMVLLERRQGRWAALAVGDLSLDAIARAEAFLVVPGGGEGFAAGTPVDAYMLRE